MTAATGRAEYTRRRDSLVDIARHWWEGKRPMGWSLAQHLKEPCVNSTSQRETMLMRAVAALEGCEERES